MALRRAIRNNPQQSVMQRPGQNMIAKKLQAMKGNMYVNNGNNVPSYPGAQMGLTQAEAEKMYGTQIRSKGFTFSGGTTLSKQVIDIPGDAKLLVGLASLNGAWGTVTFKVNQTEEIEESDTGFTKIGDNKEFYRLELPLTGRDTILLSITGYAAYVNQPFIFFFI